MLHMTHHLPYPCEPVPKESNGILSACMPCVYVFGWVVTPTASNWSPLR